jgi:hypothetical protein
MDASELRVFLRKDCSIQDDPGARLNLPYETVTINTSSEPFVFTGNGNASARSALDSVRLARGPQGTPRYKRCHDAIAADTGAVALVAFAKKIHG